MWRQASETEQVGSENQQEVMCASSSFFRGVHHLYVSSEVCMDLYCLCNGYNICVCVHVCDQSVRTV